MTTSESRRFKRNADGHPMSGDETRRFKIGEIVVVTQVNSDGTAIVLALDSAGGFYVVDSDALEPA